MFKNQVVTISQLVEVSKRLGSLNMEMQCNKDLVRHIRLALPTCAPFDIANCIIENSTYRLWCSLRQDVISQCKELENG